jgi:hypothetical protein
MCTTVLATTVGAGQRLPGDAHALPFTVSALSGCVGGVCHAHHPTAYRYELPASRWPLGGGDYPPVASRCPGVVQFDRSIPRVVPRCELSGGVSVDVRPTVRGFAKEGEAHGVVAGEGVAARREPHALPAE